MAETYEIAVCCDNCGYQGESKPTKCGTILNCLTLVFTKGERVCLSIDNKKCPNCGCNHCLKRV